ncbi:hypothetical protein GpartN1_g88.t1 [Galdieria partita]|uniref:Uncharacterized protein n=1 Tax=Galdieria partita TaxID=83374 RepID=A0A9C7PQS5_9RHOD|nr:hypothetical protein GpartN1_g88.t1 [Galdieria partita]
MQSFLFSHPSTCLCHPILTSYIESKTRRLLLRNCAHSKSAKLWMTSVNTQKTYPSDGEHSFLQVKQLLERTKKLGKLRVIVTNEASVMESICTTEKLFYAQGPNHLMYANLIDSSLNLDLHIKLEALGAVRFEQGVSRTASKDPTYIIRWLGKDYTTVVLSMFLQWDREPSDISPERIAEWKQLKEEYCQNNLTYNFQ